MSRSETALAKAEAAVKKESAKLDKAFAKDYPNHAADVKRFGQRVADYNAGWIARDNKARKK